ncbi:MAG: cell division protein ZapE [Pseudomonadota bacterium]
MADRGHTQHALDDSLAVSTSHSDKCAGSVAEAVAALVREGTLKSDPAQRETIATLDGVLSDLAKPPLANKKSSLGWLFARKGVAVSDTSVRGAYIWGGVGRGKTMLMDLFFDLAPVDLKRRVHFHAFMQDVHSRIHVWRQQQRSAKARSADPIPPLAADLAKQARLLCFDEFAVSDVADAMILARLFTALFDHGVTVIATSNVRPDLLYKDGLNRSFFLPFIALVKERLQVVELASDRDYRMARLANADAYMVGLDSHGRFHQLWGDLTGDITVEAATLDVKGRHLTFEQSAGGLLRTSFDVLCGRALGAGDYLAVAARFHTVFLEGVPIMDHARRNEAKRFITLVDTLYDAGRIVIIQAEAAADALYPVAHGTEAFEFARTISRLQEMQSVQWLEAHR